MTLRDRDEIKEGEKTWCINKASRSNLNVGLVTGEAFDLMVMMKSVYV